MEYTYRWKQRGHTKQTTVVDAVERAKEDDEKEKERGC